MNARRSHGVHLPVDLMLRISGSNSLRYLALALTGLWLTSCVHYTEPVPPPGESNPQPARVKPHSPKDSKLKPSEPAKGTAKVTYSATHDEEIKAIFALASKGEWEEAETRANALIARDPQDQEAQRLLSWVRKDRELKRQQALEDKIREIDAKNPDVNPTIPSLLAENKDRGLPPRKDVRDTIERIEATPYIPSSYGKTNYIKGALFDLESPQGQMAKILDKQVSIHLDNATLESIIFNIGQSEGINFVADKSLPAFKQTLSVNMGKVKLSSFLRYVSRNLGLQFQVGDDLIWIVDAKDEKKQMEETRFYKLKRGFILPAEFGPPEVLRTSTTVNNVTTVSEQQKMAKFVNDMAPTTPAIENAMKEFLPASCKYMIDYERNLIVARGSPEDLETLDNIVREFDRPIQQVLIEARFVTVSEATFLQLGMTWESGRNVLTSGAGAVDYTGLALGNPALPIQETRTGILSRADLSATLTLLQQSGESQTLSAPRLTVINNLPATISDGEIQYYYEQYAVKQQILELRSTSQLVPDGKPTKLTSGVVFQVLASIGGDGKTIFLALNPQINASVKMVPFTTITDRDANGNIVDSFDLKLPQIASQELATRVVVRSGQTVVMGGVLERTQTRYVESVPILGSIPILGAAFRRRAELDQPRYLLIFVTATLLSDSGEFLVYDDDQGPATSKGEKR